MDSIPDYMSLSVELKRKIEVIQDRAQHADEGDTFFLQVSSNPVVSLFITTGKVIDEATAKKNIHLHYSPQDKSYPNIIKSALEMHTMGLNSYNSGIKEDKKLDMHTYKQKFYDLCHDIDECIKVNHAVKCYQDGDEDNQAPSNVFYLHICDILNLIISKEVLKLK